MQKTEISLMRPTDLQKNTSSKAEWSHIDKSNLSKFLGRVCVLQRVYGKKPEELETLVDGFAFFLSPYRVEDVIRAIAEYVRKNPEIPTPSDIIKIIDPPSQPWKPDTAYYISLKKILEHEGVYGLSEDEIDYVRSYEDYMQKQKSLSIS